MKHYIYTGVVLFNLLQGQLYAWEGQRAWMHAHMAPYKRVTLGISYGSALVGFHHWCKLSVLMLCGARPLR